MIIGLCGYAGSGKDTAASFLEGFQRRAFADKLKELALELNPWFDTFDLEYAVEGAGWTEAKKDPQVREYLQDLGMGHRKVFGDDFWIRVAFQEIFSGEYPYFAEDNDIVVTDVRLPNEAEFIKCVEGRLFLIQRPGHRPPNNHVTEQIENLAPYIDRTILNPHGCFDELKININFWAQHYKEVD